jgi:hypothetical protein
MLPNPRTSGIHLPVPLCSTPITALLGSYGDSDSSGVSLALSEVSPLHLTRPSRAILPPTTQRPPTVAFARYPSARWISPRGDQASPFPSRLAEASGRIEFGSCGLAPHLRVLPTPPHGDAVPVGYRPESVCLKRTCTSLNVCARGRTRGAIYRALFTPTCNPIPGMVRKRMGAFGVSSAAFCHSAISANDQVPASLVSAK